MKMDSKYSIGEKVFKLSDYRKEIFDKCPSCDGKCKIPLADQTSLDCPRCLGKGLISIRSHQFYCVSSSSLTIGQVRFCHDYKNTEISYMCEETGVGSGHVYKEESLFANQLDAQSEANRLNCDPGNVIYLCPLCRPETKRYRWAGNSQWLDCSIHGSQNHVSENDYLAGEEKNKNV